ncbi:protein kinase [Streptomyces sp. LX-29]|uniref:serine/threonine-protein kinase n=1 Tax=Streptomyces sp. LX-29 TaxID=2900152 RepID=UPI00240E8BC9|nr:protein kinase [Streptomyces sp. LX-29]WFB07880.1 protein kinase [Streptomyces sp. LX-29]
MSEAEQTQDTTGRLLAGRYRLDGVLGRGGMGTVWRARDETLGRVVAVKELRFPSSVDEDEKRRLITRTLREAKAIARIRSSGAVTVYDVVDEDDRPWIVMELIEGRSLADVVRDDGPLASRRAAEVGLAVLDVLRAAHREGILHRDVKPSNVLIADDGRVVLTDFGIAQVEGDPSVTSTGMLVGAPSYISPERARGHKPGPPADLWSLGGLLYAAVEGVPPYDKSSAIATLTAVMTEPVDPPKNAGPALEEVIYGLLDKDPQRRLDDAGARALLTEAMNAREEPQGVSAIAEPTRTMALPTPPPPAQPPAAPRRPTAAPRAERADRPERTDRTAADRPDRTRGGLRSGRGAASSVRRSEPSSVSPPAPPSPPRASITDVVPRRTLVIIAVVVALAIVGTVLAIVLSGGDSDNSGAKNTSASTGAGAGADKDQGDAGDKGVENKDGSGSSADSQQGQAGEEPQSDAEEGSDDAESDDKKPEDDAEKDADKGDAGKDALPSGYERLQDEAFHFVMGLPKGWDGHPVPNYSGGRIYRSSDQFPRVQIDFNPNPKDDAAAAWRAAEPGARQTMSGYRGLGIKEVDWRGFPTVADWQFERDQGGTRVRVLNRGFKVDDSHGYAIMITCEKDKWDDEECQALRKTAFASFKSVD